MIFNPKTPEQLRTSMRVLSVILPLTTVLAFASVATSYRFWNRETESDVLKPARVSAFWDTILYDGDISTESVARVKNYIDGDKDGKLTVFYIQKSNGGNAKAADTLVDLLNEHKITVVFPNDSKCSSSCVALLIHAKNREVQPTSSFGFHQGWVREHDWSFGGVYRLLVDGNWPKKADYMDDWVREISPDFLIFLEGCPSNPLRNEKPLLVPWSVITKIANHAFPSTCDQALKPPP